MFLTLFPDHPRRHCWGARPHPHPHFHRRRGTAPFPFPCGMATARARNFAEDSSSSHSDMEAFSQLLETPLQVLTAFTEALPFALQNSKELKEKLKRKKEEDEKAGKKVKFEIQMGVEGYAPNELDVKLVDSELTVSGKKERKDEEKGEFETRSFKRTVRVPEDVELDQLACNFDQRKGTMTISAPRKLELPQKEKEKVIPVTLVENEEKAVENGEKEKEKEPESA